mgnify:CR=1 FL=1
MPQRLIVILAVLALAILSSPLRAQTEAPSCPALVEAALAAVSEGCARLGRDQACYGHTQVTATTWEDAPLEDFTAPGDQADLAELAALATFPMNVDQGTWGVAALSLRADLPESLPGQYVTFLVFGDAELTSDVPPQDLAGPLLTCEATATGGVNLRTGPGTAYAIAGGLAAGDAVTVTGRDAAGDWFSIDLASQTAWVSAPLLRTDCAVDALPVVEAGAPARSYAAPMQAFYLTTGLGEPACREAPRDGLLVQAPQETTVHFLINGVAVTVGSTALLQTRQDTLRVNAFDGAVGVTSARRTRTAEPGQRVDVVPGQPPAEPEPFDIADVRGAPVDLLPEPVQIPPPAGTIVSAVRCALAEGGRKTVPTGEPLAINFGWAAPTPDYLHDFLDAATVTLTYDGSPLDLWNLIGPTTTEQGNVAIWHYWVVPDPTPGEHQLVVMYTLSRAILDGGDYDQDGQLDVFGPGTETLACALTVR